MVKKILTVALAMTLAFGMTNTVYAKESTEKVGTISTVETSTFSLNESQMTEEQKSQYEKALSGDGIVLEVGESLPAKRRGV